MSEYDSMLIRQRVSKVVCLDANHADEKLKELENLIISTKGSPPANPEDVIEEVVQLSQLKDTRIKKLVYLYLTLTVKVSPDILLLMTNSIFGDTTDPSPVVRCCVLESVVKLDMEWEKSREVVLSVLDKGLQDPASSVRNLAVAGICNIFKIHGDHIMTDAKYLFGKVVTLLQNDPDPTVVVNCVRCIAECDGTNNSIQEFLLSLIERINMLDYWPAVTILTVANSKLECKKLSENDIFSLLNQLDCLTHPSHTTTLQFESFSLMLKLSKNLPNVRKDLTAQLISRYLNMLPLSSSALKFTILKNLLQFARDPNNKTIFQEKLYSFMLVYGDSFYVKTAKLELLLCLTSEQNADALFDNIRPYLHNNSHCVVRLVFKMLEVLFQFLPLKISYSIRQLLTSKSEIVLEACVNVLAHLVHGDCGNQPNIDISQLFSCELTDQLLASYNHLASDEAKCSIVCLILRSPEERHLKQISELLSAEVSKHFSETIVNSMMAHCILRAVVNLFLKWPKYFEKMLKTLFSRIVEIGKGDLYDSVRLYYGLMKHDIETAKHVVNVTSLTVLPETSENIVVDNINAISQISMPIT
ncbi:AP-4 complex subunit beta-1-like [Ciona intestinalis]